MLEKQIQLSRKSKDRQSKVRYAVLSVWTYLSVCMILCMCEKCLYVSM